MVIYEYPPLGGGTGIACAQLLARLAGMRGIDIDLVTSTAEPEPSFHQLEANLRIHKLSIRKQEMHYWRSREIAAWTWSAIRYADRLSRERRFDLAHCWGGWPAGLVGYRLRHRLPYIVSLRGSDVPGYNPRLHLLDPLLFRGVSRRVWRGAARVVAVSRNLRELAYETWPNAAISVIPNGVNADLFTPGSIDTRGLLFVGRLIERKGVHTLIEAFAGLAARHPDLRLSIVGDGPQRRALEAQAAKHFSPGQVIFHGRLDHSALARIYQESSIFILPAVSDAMPNVVLEAMAAGLAIVTTRTGAGELIRDNGVVIDRPEAPAIREAIVRYLQVPELLAAHRKNSRCFAECMSWDRIAESVLTLYSEIKSNDLSPRGHVSPTLPTAI